MRIWKVLITVEELNRRCKNSLSDHIGIVFTEVGDDFITATMPIDQRTLQPMGIMHGGASCVLAETLGSIAGIYSVDPATHTCVGLEINVNHIRAVRSGYVTGTAWALHRGKTTHVWEIKIFDELKRLTSASRLTLAVLELKK